MNVTRTAIVGVVGGALAAWIAAAATSGSRHVDLPVAPKSAAIDASGAELAAEIIRLHDRLHPTTVPRQPARNLFEFNAEVRARVVAAAAAPAAAPVAEAASPAAAEAPPLSLIGVAEDSGVRTAIISMQGQLFLVKEGEAVADRYAVARVGSDTVDLTDGKESTTVHLALK
jgi:hypothetical protein